MAYDFTTSVSVARFEHEPDIFDDLFVSVDGISQVFDLAKSKLQAEDKKKFFFFRSQRLLKVPLDQLRAPTQEKASQQAGSTSGKEVKGADPVLGKKDDNSKAGITKIETTAQKDTHKPLVQTEKGNTGTDAHLHIEKGSIESKNIEQAPKNDTNNNESSQLGGQVDTKFVVSPHFLNQYQQFSQQIGLQNTPQVDNPKDQDVEIILENPTGENC